MDEIVRSDDLPLANLFWKKVKQDLNQGYRVVGKHPHYIDIVRSMTCAEKPKDAIPHKFLLVATAKQNLDVLVSSLELQAYSAGDLSWKLRLIANPFPDMHWKVTWQMLKNTYPVGEPNNESKNIIISQYLESSFDYSATHESFCEFSDKLGFKRVSWVGKN